MGTLANKHCHCLKYADAWAVNSSHTDDVPHDKWTRFESSALRSQWPPFCVGTVTRWWWLSLGRSPHTCLLGNLQPPSVISSLVFMMIVSPYLCGKLGFAKV
jgi:hypothetical protein